MKLNNMRWGYDGGFACGPVEGSTYVEAELTDESGKKHFVLMSRMAESCKIEIAEAPLFDLAMQGEFDEVHNLAEESYDFERESAESDAGFSAETVYPCAALYKSGFSGGIKLTLRAMESCYNMQNPTDADAHVFAEKYLGKEIEF